jgi:hypothetical protein
VVCHLIGYDIDLVLDVEMLRPGENEVAAAKRLLERVIQNYSRFFDAVVGDALYFESPFFNFCLAHGKHVLAVLKENNPGLLQDAKGLFSSMNPEVREEPRKTIKYWDVEGFNSAEGIKVPIRILHTEETERKRERIAGCWVEKTEEHFWYWGTTIPKEVLPSHFLWKAGHGRWGIENNIFKDLNTYWHLDHCFKHNPTAIINFVLTLFIVFVLMQSFYMRNLKPQLRNNFSLISISRQLFIGLADLTFRVPWLDSLSIRDP